MAREMTWAENEVLTTPVTDLQDVEAVLRRWRMLLGYEPDTGLLVWLMITPNEFNRKACVATFGAKGGHGMISLDGFKVSAAKVVWLLHHGAWPPTELRRLDGDVSNDRIENLALNLDVPSPIQGRLRKRPIGVARYGNRWQAYYSDANGQKGLGVYDTLEEAVAARVTYDRDPEGWTGPQRRRNRPVGVARYGNRWQAYYRAPDGYQIDLGRYDTEDAAAAARVAYERDPAGWCPPPRRPRRTKAEMAALRAAYERGEDLV